MEVQGASSEMGAKTGVHTLGGGEVDDIAVGLEHVDLLDGLDGLSVQLLQGLLELLVIGAGSGRRTLDLSAGSTLATIFPRQKGSPTSISHLSLAI